MALKLDYTQKDYDALLAELKQTIQTQVPQWTDFLDSDVGYAALKTFAGLADFNNFYLDRQAAETYLATAELESSVYALTKPLDYTPDAQLSAQTSVTFSIVSPYFQDIIIPKHAPLTIHNKAWHTITDAVITQGSTSTTVTATQGIYYTVTYTSTGQRWQKYNLAQNLINVTVVVGGVPWEKADSFINPAQENVYRLYPDRNGQTLLFGGGVFAKIPPTGLAIMVSGVLSNGTQGNAEGRDFSVNIITPIRNTLNQDITSLIVATADYLIGGEDGESLATIKDLAPKWYATQYRSVVAEDYRVAARKVPGVRSATAWGGEEDLRYGEVWVAVYGDNPASVPQALLDTVRATLEARKVTTVQIKVVAPIIVFVDIVCTAFLAKLENSSIIRNTVQGNIAEYFSTLDIGSRVELSDLMAKAAQTPGVDYVDLSLTTEINAFVTAGVLRATIMEYADPTSIEVWNTAGTTQLWTYAQGGHAYSGSLFTLTLLGQTQVKIKSRSLYPNIYLPRRAVATSRNITVYIKASGQPV